MDEELTKQLESLAEGEEITILQEGEEVTFRKPKTPVLCLEHDFQKAGEKEEQCAKCGQGRVN